MALSLNKLNDIIISKRKHKKKLYVLYNRRFYFITKRILSILKKNKFEKFELSICEREKAVIKKMSKKIVGKIKYHLTSHWIDWFIFLSKEKKYKFYKIQNDQIFEKKYINKNLKININNKKIDPLRVLIKFKKFTLICDTLEKLFIYKNKKKKLVIDEKSKNKIKPGIQNIVKEIKKNIKNKSKKTSIPQPEELKDLYKNLENLNY